MNLYEYVHSNPLIYLAPNGLGPFKDCMHDALRDFIICSGEAGTFLVACVEGCRRTVCRWWPPYCAPCILTCLGDCITLNPGPGRLHRRDKRLSTCPPRSRRGGTYAARFPTRATRQNATSPEDPNAVSMDGTAHDAAEGHGSKRAQYTHGGNQGHAKCLLCSAHRQSFENAWNRWQRTLRTTVGATRGAGMMVGHQ